ncbi:matrixin family metalloprotease [Secundilactobacillus folii]|uniref:Matrixin family metalloprotease n=1 Tax=Secundilactobacillus folii TaxID=2678357 RepID=A0A7X3C2X3_9LACO|nr:matrixin family metalloprotease [Secundilactobacillus folii]MTV82302.1 matrixin family metalloprotease [Secundilactobacillus folii]
MNNHSVSSVLVVLAVALGLSVTAVPSNTKAKMSHSTDATKVVKRDSQRGSVSSLNSPATGSASVTPASKRWKSTTVTYKISSGSSYYTNIWKNAVKKWNAGGVVNLVPTSGKPDISLSTCNSSLSNSGTVGITYSTYYNGSKMNNLQVMASAKSYIYRNVSKKFKYSKAERTNVAEHELGHALGLQHNVGKASVMYYATRDRSVSKPDIKGLQESYR